jgi:hypothetical protein
LARPELYKEDTIRKDNKQKSSKIIKMRMFATLDKAKPDTENIRGLNLAAVMCMTVQVSRLSLQCKLLVTRA